MSKFTYKETEVQIEGEPELDGFGAEIKPLCEYGAHRNWWLGNIINKGEARHGDKIFQVIAELGISKQTVQQACSIDRLMSLTIRRPPERLPWTCHLIVAWQTPQRQEELLALAESKHLSTSELRKIVQGDDPETDFAKALESQNRALQKALRIAPEGALDGLLEMENVLARIRKGEK